MHIALVDKARLQVTSYSLPSFHILTIHTLTELLFKGKFSDEIALSVKDTNNDMPDEVIEESRLSDNKTGLINKQLWVMIDLSPKEFRLHSLFYPKKTLALKSKKRLEIIDFVENNYDIAILKLLSPLDFNSYIGPACLPPSQDFYPENYRVTHKDPPSLF